jgi:hypothetical protein
VGPWTGCSGTTKSVVKTRAEIFAIVTSLEQLQQRADDKSMRTLYELVVEDAIVGCIDPIIEELTKATSSHKELAYLRLGATSLCGLGIVRRLSSVWH